IIYTYYQDRSLTPAAEDDIWLTFDAASVQELTPEEQACLAEAASYASEVEDGGSEYYILALKTVQYVYADAENLYVGYGGETVQTLAHGGTEMTPDATTLLARDMNFDGSEDVLLAASAGTANTYYYRWLYDPAEGNFTAYPGFEEL